MYMAVFPSVHSARSRGLSNAKRFNVNVASSDPFNTREHEMFRPQLKISFLDPEQMETGTTRIFRPPLRCVILSDGIAIFFFTVANASKALKCHGL